VALLLPYQTAWIEDRSRVKIWEKSRQIGASWVCALEAVLHATGPSRRAHVAYTGYNERMARQFIDDCATWARALDKIVSMPDAPLIDTKTGILSYALYFSGGGKIEALSSRPENFRSRGGLAVIDEAAYHGDLDGLLKAAVPFLVWGGRVNILSTHNGRESAFARLVEDTRAGRTRYSLHRTTFDEALAQGLYRRICETQGLVWSVEAERSWANEIYEISGDAADEELRCIPSRSGGQYIDPGVLEAASSGAAREAPVLSWTAPAGFAARSDHEREIALASWIATELLPACATIEKQVACTIGEDFARVADLTVLPVLTSDRRGRCRVALVVELRDTPYQQQLQVLRALVTATHPDKIYLDATGNGGYLAERCVQLYGESVACGVTITKQWYADTMPPLRAALEDGLLMIPHDVGLLGDLAAVRVVAGQPSIPRPVTDARGLRRHGDFAIALAMAYAAMRECVYTSPVRYQDRVRPDLGTSSRARAGLSRGGGLW
jgi:phage FluMu gp28-like protein